MRNKKLQFAAAMLSAALLAAHTGALSATAYEPYINYEKLDTLGRTYDMPTDGFGTLYYKDPVWHRDFDFIAVTTAEGLPDSIVEEEKDIKSLIEWKDYRVEHVVTALDTSRLYERYGNDIRIYHVRSNPNYGDMLYWVCREFALKHETVLETALLESKYEGTGIWDGTISLSLNRDISDALDAGRDVPAYDAARSDMEMFFEEMETLYTPWRSQFDDWNETVNSPAMTGQERLDSLNAAGITDPYTMMMTAQAKTDEFLAAHADVFSEKSIGIKPLEDPLMVYQTFSAWSYMGDLDEDGAVTAADASIILAAGARSGAGLHSGLTEVQIETGDLNSDYSVNAEDAAFVLMYAAEDAAEPDSSEDIGDFIMRSMRSQLR